MIAREYLKDFLNQSEELEGLTDVEIRNSRAGIFSTFLDFSGLAPAWELRDEPKEFCTKAVVAKEVVLLPKV